MKKATLLSLFALAATMPALGQSNGLTDTSKSQYAKMANTPIDAVTWTDGFWGDRFNVYSNTSLQSMWETWNNPDISHGYRNF